MLTDEEIMAQVFAAFREEQAEHRQAAGEILLELERDPNHPQRKELLAQLFREAHSLKGGARAAGQFEIEHVAHRLEDIFSAVRKGDLDLTPEVCDPIYAALDAIGTLMDQVLGGKKANLETFQPLLAKLNTFVDQAGQQSDTPQTTPPDDPATSAPSTDDALNVQAGRGGSELPAPTVRLATQTLDNLLNEAGELMTCTIRAREQARDIDMLAELPSRWRRIWRQAQPVIARQQKLTPALRPTVHHLDDRAAPYCNGSAAVLDRDTAVLLESLAQANNVIAELENQLAKLGRRANEDHARLTAITDRLHDQVRRTRMLPLATLFNPLRLQLREIARSAGKQVTLNLQDGEIEVDRQVLEQLREVLLHLLRNAIDHGIEPSELRQQHGKAASGCITLSARVQGDQLTLALADDGAGLDLAAIRHRAVVTGIQNEADIEQMSATDLVDLIFLPGFSTKQTVGALSGRGVGLDIVRSLVERMYGRVMVHSIPGLGTTFTLKVPLSLTSSRGLLLQVGKANYILPLDTIQRIIQVEPDQVRLLEGQAALILDQRPLPLVHLADLLGEEASGSLWDGAGSARHLGLIMGSGERQIACLVQGVLGEQELVIHRLPTPLQRVRFVAGASILADGSVVAILDAVDVVRAALGARSSLPIAIEAQAPRRTPTILVVDDSITTRMLEKNILEAAGYQVFLAIDGVEALDMLRQLADGAGCDLLISDVDMPRLNGFDLTMQVRNNPHFQHLPIVLVTSLDTPGDRERGIAAGADAYIVKRSFDQQVLLDTIAQLL